EGICISPSLLLSNLIPSHSLCKSIPSCSPAQKRCGLLIIHIIWISSSIHTSKNTPLCLCVTLCLFQGLFSLIFQYDFSSISFSLLPTKREFSRLFVVNLILLTRLCHFASGK